MSKIWNVSPKHTHKFSVAVDSNGYLVGALIQKNSGLEVLEAYEQTLSKHEISQLVWHTSGDGDLTFCQTVFDLVCKSHNLVPTAATIQNQNQLPPNYGVRPPFQMGGVVPVPPVHISPPAFSFMPKRSRQAQSKTTQGNISQNYVVAVYRFTGKPDIFGVERLDPHGNCVNYAQTSAMLLLGFPFECEVISFTEEDQSICLWEGIAKANNFSIGAGRIPPQGAKTINSGVDCPVFVHKSNGSSGMMIEAVKVCDVFGSVIGEAGTHAYNYDLVGHVNKAYADIMFQSCRDAHGLCNNGTRQTATSPLTFNVGGSFYSFSGNGFSTLVPATICDNETPQKTAPTRPSVKTKYQIMIFDGSIGCYSLEIDEFIELEEYGNECLGMKMDYHGRNYRVEKVDMDGYSQPRIYFK